MSETANPSFPGSNPVTPDLPPPPPAPIDPVPINPIASATTPSTPEGVLPVSPTVPDLTVPQPPQFPNGNNTPPPLPTDPPIMVRGENVVPNMPQEASSGLTTATILPVGSGGTDMISYSSNSGGKRFLLPLIIGLVVILAIAGGTFLFFSANGEGEGIEAPAVSEETEEVTSEPSAQITPESSVTTATYSNLEFSLTMDYPQDWTQKENINGNVVVFTDATSGTLAPSKISLRAEATTSELAAYAESLQKIYTQLYTGWVPVNTAETTLGTLPALEVESTYTKGAVNISVLQLIVIREGKAFTITAEAEESAFLQLRQTFTQVLASLQFTN